MNLIGRCFLQLYRSERTVRNHHASAASKRFAQLAGIFGGPHAREGITQLDHWMNRQPYASSKRLFGSIDSIHPVPAKDGNVRTIIRGWLFDVRNQIESVNLWSGKTCLASGPIWEPRKDVASVFPGEKSALLSGFEFFLDTAIACDTPITFTARLLTGEMVHGSFEPYVARDASIISPRLESIPSERMELKAAYILAQPNEDNDVQFTKCRAALEACRSMGIPGRLVLLNRSPSVTTHLLKEFPSMNVIRSVDEFTYIVSSAPSPSAIFALDPDALWYCDRLLRLNAPLFSRLTIIDDSRAFCDAILKDSRTHATRSRFCQILIDPSGEEEGTRNTGVSFRHRLTAPTEPLQEKFQEIYTQAISLLLTIS